MSEEANKAAVRRFHEEAWRWTATGPPLGQRAGGEATGRPMRFSGTNVFRFSDGKVVEIWNHRDDFGLREQLGVPIFAGAPAQPGAERR